MTSLHSAAPPAAGPVPRTSRGKPAIVMVAIAVLAIAGYVTVAPPGPRSLRVFDPPRLANLELRMWQAYYAKQNVRLFTLLVTLLREQYHYSWVTATREGFHLARAAATFGNARSHYEQVLPDLESGYGTAKRWLDARFDPAAVARAELAWWVARRTPGQNSPAQVGELIADEYTLLYETPRARVLQAARLRAEAAAMRDAEASSPDWATIGQLLDRSYAELHRALGDGGPDEDGHRAPGKAGATANR